MRRRTVGGIFSTVSPSSPSPSTYAGFPEDMDDWGCSMWEIYYNRNKAAYGKQQAVEIVNTDIDRVGFWANIWWCQYNDCDWTRRMKAEGLNVTDFIASDLICAGGNVAKAIEQTTRPGVIKPLLFIGGFALGAYALDKAGLLPKWKK